MPTVLKSGSLNLLETSGPVQTYNGIAFPFLPLPFLCTQSRIRTLGFNCLTPNDPYMSRTAPLTSKHCILYIYSTNIGTEYFKHALYSPFFFSSKCSWFHNANLFGSCIIHILYTECAKIKKNNSGAKGLICTALRLVYSVVSTVDTSPGVVFQIICYWLCSQVLLIEHLVHKQRT